MRNAVNCKYEPVDKIAITQICNNPRLKNRFCVQAPCILSIFILFFVFSIFSVVSVDLVFIVVAASFKDVLSLGVVPSFVLVE